MGGALQAAWHAPLPPPSWQEPLPSESCRWDLREQACFPYLPVEDQGGDVSCVAHAFSMALYCAERNTATTDPLDFPAYRRIFEQALAESPDKNRGVSFEAVGRALERHYALRMARLSARYAPLPNCAQQVRAALLQGTPVVAGYQVNAAIDLFHRDKRVCRSVGYLLPRFRSRDVSLTGHAVLLLGYDFRVQSFIARNSWGRAWGVDGHFLVPFAAVQDEDAFTDLWALRSVPTGPVGPARLSATLAPWS